MEDESEKILLHFMPLKIKSHFSGKLQKTRKNASFRSYAKNRFPFLKPTVSVSEKNLLSLLFKKQRSPRNKVPVT